MSRPTCILAGAGSCSDDVHEVWHGLPIPLHPCGYHESRQDTRRQAFGLNHAKAKAS